MQNGQHARRKACFSMTRSRMHMQQADIDMHSIENPITHMSTVQNWMVHEVRHSIWCNCLSLPLQPYLHAAAAADALQHLPNATEADYLEGRLDLHPPWLGQVHHQGPSQSDVLEKVSRGVLFVGLRLLVPEVMHDRGDSRQESQLQTKVPQSADKKSDFEPERCELLLVFRRRTQRGCTATSSPIKDGPQHSPDCSYQQVLGVILQHEPCC